MQNLLEETLEKLVNHNKSGNDVKFVTNGKDFFSWKWFCDIAKTINYNDGFGGNEIKLSLKVVGKDWWLERHEYDGSEWWEFKTIPILNAEFKRPEIHDIMESKWL